ncbi:MAG: zinc-ribbon domain-containing protein [Alphaproteobacteria bacterium]|nr:zinc-ribbon domain-containing protein [Alphaproteobacteria bacterium]
MRILCPSCQAAYEVPDKLLSSGPRKVRCAKCGGDWMAEAEPEPAPVGGEPEPEMPRAAPRAPEGLPPEGLPPEDDEPDLPPPPPVVPQMQPAGGGPEAVVPRPEEKLVPEPGERPSRKLALVAGLAWLASVAVLAGAGWAAVAFRAEVMAAWAPSRRLFALLGLG